MPKTKSARGPSKQATPLSAPTDVAAQLATTLAWLERRGTKKTRDSMAGYGIHADKAFGVTMADIKKLGKQLGHNHELAAALWASGWYEARLLTSFVDDPAQVSAAQMARWCKDFDNWAVCDTVCFHLFDRTPHAFEMIAKWSELRPELQRRAAFALLASVALHDKRAGDAQFLRCLPLIERAASDERNFVAKGVVWALRAVGERNTALNTAAVALARRLGSAPDAAARWVGKDALKKLVSPAVTKRLATRSRAAAK